MPKSDGKKVFVFGAGASRASQDSQKNPQAETHIAPLVNELFKRHYQDAAYAILSGSDFDRCETECQRAIENGGNLERWLTERWEAISTFGPQKQRAEKAFFGRVCFYLWRLLQRVSETYQGANGNTYYLLMRKLIDRDDDFALISFNYDTLLDRAVIEVLGCPLRSVGEYLDVPLIKPHGSVNWLLERDDDPEHRREAPSDHAAWLSTASALMYNGSRFDAEHWTVVDPTETALREIGDLRVARNNYFYPLLFMPVTTKWYEVVNGFHQLMIRSAWNEIEQASAIYVIGYSANDDVFAQIMGSARERTSLYVVGVGDGASEIAERILKTHPRLRLEKTYPVGFHRFADEWY